MKRFIYILAAFCLVIIWTFPASAIDKSKKDNPTPPKKNQTVDKQQQKQSKTVTDSKAATSPDSQTRRKSYDDFVDRNNNGIDDRAEKRSPAPKPKKPDTRKKTVPDKPKP